MKIIYTSEDRFMVWDVKNILKLAGFNCHIRNEYAAGGAGDIAPIETWPEIWIDDESYDEALKYLESHVFNQSSSNHDWTCTQCGEVNGASFEVCWNCGHDVNSK